MYQEVHSTYSDEQQQQQQQQRQMAIAATSSSSPPSPPPTVMPFLGCVGNSCGDGDNLFQSTTTTTTTTTTAPSWMFTNPSAAVSSSSSSSGLTPSSACFGFGGGSASDGRIDVTNKTSAVAGSSAAATLLDSHDIDVDMDYSDAATAAAATAATGTTSMIGQQQEQQQQRHPNTTTHHDEADQVGARELQLLTPKQRERLFEDIHGVVDIQVENEEFISKKLQQLDDEVSKIRDKSAYSRALFLNPRYVKDRKFRLMFLRATSFHPKNAAKRMVTHFKYKSELFGLDKVAKSITLDDLDYDNDDGKDMGALRSGGTIFLSQTDSAGRPITLAVRKRNDNASYKHEFRAQWYSAMVALEENETLQRYGHVIVCFTIDIDVSGPMDRGYETISKFHMLRDGLPLRRTAFHFCYNNSTMKTAISVFRTICGPEFRLRFRDHCGTYQECAYSLMTYGIDKNTFPFDEEGKLKQDVMDNWIEERRKKEAINKEKDNTIKEIYSPTVNDVLLGRGKPFQNHWGNLQMVKLLEERQEEYKNADRFQKTCLSWEIVQKIQTEMNGRFLEKTDSSDEWRVVSDDVAREKVSSGFRSIKKLLRSTGTANGISGIVLEDDSEGRRDKRAKHG